MNLWRRIYRRPKILSRRAVRVRDVIICVQRVHARECKFSSMRVSRRFYYYFFHANRENPTENMYAKRFNPITPLSPLQYCATCCAIIILIQCVVRNKIIIYAHINTNPHRPPYCPRGGRGCYDVWDIGYHLPDTTTVVDVNTFGRYDAWAHTSQSSKIPAAPHRDA